jgi:hypothetical protein
VITLLKTQFALRTMDARRAATVPALVTFWKPPTYLKLSSCPKLSAL